MYNKGVKKIGTWFLVLALIIAQCVSLNSFTPAFAKTEEVLKIHGEGLKEDIEIGLVDLKEDSTLEVNVSSNNKFNFHKISAVKGADLFKLFKEDNLIAKDSDEVIFTCSDGYKITKTIEELRGQNYFSDFTLESKKSFSPMLAFYKKELISVAKDDFNPPVKYNKKEITDEDDLGDYPTLILGQNDIDDMNQSKWGKNIVDIQVGAKREVKKAIEISVNGELKTILLDELKNMADKAGVEEAYTYNSKGGLKEVNVKGIKLNYILKEKFNLEEKEGVVKLETSDGYKVPEQSLEDIYNEELKYIVVYAVDGESVSDDDGKALVRVYRKQRNKDEFGTVFKAISGIVVESSNKKIVEEVKEVKTENKFRHLDYDAAPYKIDAITGATFTVEGPGTENYRALAIRQIEEMQDDATKITVKEIINGKEIQNEYEGIPLNKILDNFIRIKDNAGELVLKDKSRKEVLRIDYNKVKDSKDDYLVCYGVNGVPLVYQKDDDGYIEGKYNDDGCLKFIYNAEKAIDFSNIAYVYVTEKDAKNIFEHINSPYSDSKYTGYMVTLKGSALGKEVNYTVSDIEKMDDIKIQKEYSLSNSEYFWYYNQYKGVKLWDLMLKAGLDPKIDESTTVQLVAADHYNFPKLTIKDIKDDSLYGYYEKDPRDLGDGEFDGKDIKPLEKGAPVLLAYGFNGYPYVYRPTDNGYNSGLGNDGGPVRVIFGKKSYDHNNGSGQVQFAKEIIIGDAVDHTSHINKPYDVFKNNKISFKVTDPNGKIVLDKEETIEEFEKSIKDLSRAQKDEAILKQFYFTKVWKDNKINDLYEGVNVEYLLKNILKLSTLEGKAIFTGSNGDKIEKTISEMISLGKNEVSGIENINANLAYAKNGYPMVQNKDDLGYSEHNNGGPLMLVMPQVNEGEPGETLDDVIAVEIILESDSSSHNYGEYEVYKDNTLKISGEGVSKQTEWPVRFLEGLQNYIEEKTYTIAKTETVKYDDIYKGLDLYSFLKNEAGLKLNADMVTFIAEDGYSIDMSIEDLAKNDYYNSITGKNDLGVLLAYGKNNKPLVSNKNSKGYISDSKNSGGPLKLVVGQRTKDDINSKSNLSNLVEIKISAKNADTWGHDNGVYKMYLDKPVLSIVGDQLRESKTFTLRELESMKDIVVRDSYTGDGEHILEGLDLWKLISKVGLKDNISDPNVRIFSGSSYNQIIKDVSALKNGQKNSKNENKKIILAYAQDGYPLVAKTSDVGYEENNQNGPLRLIIEENKSMWTKWVDCIVVGQGDYEEPSESKIAKEELAEEKQVEEIQILNDFGIYGVGFPLKEFSNADIEKEGKEASYKYASKGETKEVFVKGILLTDLLKNQGLKNNQVELKIITTDGYDYGNVLFKEAEEKEYFVAVKENGELFLDSDKSGNQSNIRIYRNEDDGSTWKNKMRSIKGIQIIDSSNEAISRIEFVNKLSSVIKYDGFKRKNIFTDLNSGEDITEKVMFFVEKGIFKGYENKLFKPNSNLTREEAAVILFRLIPENLKNVDGDGILSKFNDEHIMGRWAKGDIEKMVKIGLFKGVSENKFGFKDTLSNEQADILVERIKALIK